MSIKKLNLTPFFSPADSLTVSAPGGKTSSNLGENESQGDVDKDLDIINQDEGEVTGDDKEDKTDKEDKVDEEVIDEDKEDKIDEEKTEEIEEEVSEEDAKGLYAKLKKVSPEIFKKVPELKDAIFASKAYREVYPSIEEARESKQIVDNYNALNNLVITGATDKILDEVKAVGDNEYKTFVGNFLPALWNSDKDTYYALVSPVIRQSLKSVYSKGKSAGDENLVNAALVAHIELFGDKDINKVDEPLVKEKKADPDREKLDKERKDFFEHRYSLLQNEVATELTSAVKSEIKNGLDPKNSLTPYVLNKLVDDIFNEINNKLGADTNHQASMTALWKKEAGTSFTGANKKQIIAACLNKAKALIPAVRLRLKTEALKGSNGNVQRKVEEKKEKKADLSSSNRSGTKLGNKDNSAMSDLDIINAD